MPQRIHYRIEALDEVKGLNRNQTKVRFKTREVLAPVLSPTFLTRSEALTPRLGPHNT